MLVIFWYEYYLKQSGGFVETLSPTYSDPTGMGRELIRVQESLGKLLAQLNGMREKFIAAKTTEETEIQNLSTLCKVLAVHENHQFRIYHQEEIERSLATDLLRSNFRGMVVRLFLSKLKTTTNSDTSRANAIPIIPIPGITNIVDCILTRMYPETTYAKGRYPIQEDDGLQRMQERADHMPRAGRILDGAVNIFRSQPVAQSKPALTELRETIDQVAPELRGILDGLDSDIQSYDQQTFDDKYTTWLINTQNTHYLLYDIAARTRFNTGRFTYLIKPCVYAIEQAMGPYKKTAEIQDINPILQELEKRNGMAPIYRCMNHEAFKKRLAVVAPEILPKGHMEQPGERYNTIMGTLADEATPLEHLWLPFSIPPCTIRMLENILCIADPQLSVAQVDKKVVAEPSANHRFTSTSIKSFIWNGIKHLAQWPARNLTPVITKAVRSSYDYINWSTRLVAQPFTGFITDFFNNHYGKRAKGILTRRIGDLRTRCYAIKVGSARITRTLLTKICEKQVLKLEQAMREGHPVSEQVAMLQEFVASHQVEGLARWGQAECAHHAPQIRAFARKYSQIQRIDPILPTDHEGEPVEAKATIKDARLRGILGTFVDGWKQT